jgi:hypothetical protein
MGGGVTDFCVGDRGGGVPFPPPRRGSWLSRCGLCDHAMKLVESYCPRCQS